MRYNPLLKATRCEIIGSWKGQNAGNWCADEETGAFGFWDFKIPKAFRPKLFTRDPLTVQDSIYRATKFARGQFKGHDIISCPLI
jgi:hypothetical protein